MNFKPNLQVLFSFSLKMDIVSISNRFKQISYISYNKLIYQFYNILLQHSFCEFQIYLQKCLVSSKQMKGRLNWHADESKCIAYGKNFYMQHKIVFLGGGEKKHCLYTAMFMVEVSSPLLKFKALKPKSGIHWAYTVVSELL